MKKKILCACLCTVASVMMLSGCGFGKDTGADDVNTPDDANTPDGTGASEPEDSRGDDAETPHGSIAIAMPNQSDPRWANDAEAMKKELEEKGYSVSVQFAEDDPQKQASQVGRLVEGQADCIVIAAVDSGALTEVGASAMEAGIPIIAYDRLLMDTDAVSFYATFDHKGIGIAIGQAIIEKAGLDDLADGGYKTIELFMGSPDDLNARLLHTGLMEALQPYFDSGRLECKTGRTSFEDASILGCSQEAARERCKNDLAGYYAEEELAICVAAFDSLAYGCKTALQAAGYIEENWPLLSGQGCEALACKDILDGTQAFSIYKDTHALAKKCAEMVDAVVSGTEPEINDMEQYDNHVLTVPAYLCAPVMVDKGNLQEIIIDSGYYTADQIDAAE